MQQRADSLSVKQFNKLAFASGSTAGFVDLCEYALECMGRPLSVTVDRDAVKAYAAAMPPPEQEARSFSDYISPKAWSGPLDEVRVFHEFGAIVGQMGGFFERFGGSDDVLRKWEYEGSGAKMVVWRMRDVRNELGAPGNNKLGARYLKRELEGLFMDATMPGWRVKAMSEFYRPDAMARTEAVLRSAAINLPEDKPLQGASFAFNFMTARRLAEAFPVSLGGDPFFKKATLVILQASSHLRSRKAEWMPGQSLGVDTIIASDYRIPQATTAPGIDMVRMDDRLLEKLLAQRPVDIFDADVMKLRASSVVVGSMLQRLTRQESGSVDNHLIGLGRRLDKEGKALPPMKPLSSFF